MAAPRDKGQWPAVFLSAHLWDKQDEESNSSCHLNENERRCKQNIGIRVVYSQKPTREKTNVSFNAAIFEWAMWETWDNRRSVDVSENVSWKYISSHFCNHFSFFQVIMLVQCVLAIPELNYYKWWTCGDKTWICRYMLILSIQLKRSHFSLRWLDKKGFEKYNNVLLSSPQGLPSGCEREPAFFYGRATPNTKKSKIKNVVYIC